MWEYIDTSTAGADAGTSDTLDLSLGDFGAGLEHWVAWNCQSGLNRSPCEQVWEDTDVPCDTSEECCDSAEECGQGSMVCGHDDVQHCFEGRPHGTNLRDWLYHVAAARSESDTYYYMPMVSSPCVGGSDDLYPFLGGYHYY